MAVDGGVDVELDAPAAAFLIPADRGGIERLSARCLQPWSLTEVLVLTSQPLRSLGRVAGAAGLLLHRRGWVGVQPHAQHNSAEVLVKRVACIHHLGDEPVVAQVGAGHTDLRLRTSIVACDL